MMTAKENRRANVKKLVEQYGGQAEFAKRIGKDPAQISQWATAAKSHRGKPRGMSDDMARYIEKNASLIAVGWTSTITLRPERLPTEGRPLHVLLKTGVEPTYRALQASSKVAK